MNGTKDTNSLPLNASLKADYVKHRVSISNSVLHNVVLKGCYVENRVSITSLSRYMLVKLHIPLCSIAEQNKPANREFQPVMVWHIISPIQSNSDSLTPTKGDSRSKDPTILKSCTLEKVFRGYIEQKQLLCKWTVLDGGVR